LNVKIKFVEISVQQVYILITNPKHTHMKHFFLFAFVCLGHVCFGQILIDGTDINKLEPGTHIMVEVTSQIGAKLRVFIDYGQALEGRGIKQLTIDEGDGKKEFNSPTHALNFILNNGWELVDTNVEISDARVYHFVFKRKS
jgi:hypothetical protein